MSVLAHQQTTPLTLIILFLFLTLLTPRTTTATVGWEAGEMVLDFGNEVEAGNSDVLLDSMEVGGTFSVDLTWNINQENCLLQFHEPSTDKKHAPTTIIDDGLFNNRPSHAVLPHVAELLLAARNGQDCEINGAKNEFITIARKTRPIINRTPASEFAPIGAIVMVFRATGFFTPHDVTIKTGEKIIWIYADGAQEPHSVTSGACRGNDCSGGGQAFDSGPTLTKPGQQYEHVFMKSGTFPYHCDLHLGSMQGTVTVTP